MSRGSLSRGSLSRQVSVQADLCLGGVSVQGGTSVQKVSVRSGGSLSWWVSVKWGLCPGGSLSGRPSYGYVRAVRILLECTLVNDKHTPKVFAGLSIAFIFTQQMKGR